MQTAHQPEELLLEPFRGEDAVRLGLLTPDQLRSRIWVRVIRGIYAHHLVATLPETRFKALRLVQQAHPGTVVCGRTAAWLHGAWQPLPGLQLPLDMTRPVRSPGNQVTGITKRRLVLRGTRDFDAPLTGLSALDDDVVTIDGVATTSPIRTCFDLMRGRGLVEATVVADAFAYASTLNLGYLAAYLSSRRRWPGICQARVAADLAVDDARSAGETRLRLVLVLAGHEEPLINTPVLDELSGRIIAVPDLTMIVRGDPGLGLEYDGWQHDLAEAPTLDRHRQNRLVAGTCMPILRYVAKDLQKGRRQQILKDVATIIGRRPRCDLVDADFRRPDPAFAWQTPTYPSEPTLRAISGM